MNDLAPGIVIEMDLDMLFQFKKLKRISQRSVTSGHTVSMQRVGIVLGIVGFCGLPV
jgi:hypothetical protein